MEIEAYTKKMKEINAAILSYIEVDDDDNEEFQSLIEIFDKYDILKNKEETQPIFQLISRIANNHHRESNFFPRIEKIFQYLIKEKPSPVLDFITNYKEYNKPTLLLLLEKGYLKPDDTFHKEYLKSKANFLKETFSKKNFNKTQFYYYLYPGMKQYIDDSKRKQIEKEISQNFQEDISTFEKKCHLGENDSYICTLIRQDSVEEFISYINRMNLPLSTQIKPSIYETNSFLIDKEPTLIEYASFYGSIQIIQYLKYSKVPFTFSLWLYAIHSNNAELIHFLEENEVKPEKNRDINRNRFLDNKQSFDLVLKESIKCHHNDISNYIKDNLLSQEQINELSHDFDLSILQSLNFYFFPDEVSSIISKTRKDNQFNVLNLLFSLKKLTIPTNVTSIGSNAFSKCSSIKQIIIPSSVTSICEYAFSECTSLNEIEIPSSVTSIEGYAFYQCSSLKHITIPSSVTKISEYTFANCSSLEKIVIPSSVTEIHKYSFNKCFSLKEIEIPSSITKISEYTFADCSSLVNLTIPSSINSIENDAFIGCTSLKQITIPSSVKAIANFTFFKCSSLTQITIPSSVTSIGEYAFSDCSSLTQITIPSSVRAIGNYAFYKCISLKQISILSKITLIGDSVFSSCSSLEQISIPPSVVSLGRNAFYACSSLKQITIPPSVKSIGNYAFYECKSLEKVSIPSSVNSIGSRAFYSCDSLDQITIPSSVNSIGSDAFSPKTTVERI